MHKPLRHLLALAIAASASGCSSENELADAPVTPTDISYSLTATGGERPGTLQISESADAAALNVAFSPPAPRAFVLTYVVSGDAADIQTGSNTIQVAAGATNVALPLVPIDDDRIEADESFSVSLTASDSGFANQVVSIVLTSDDAPYDLTVGSITVTEPDRGGEVATLVFGIDRPAAGTIDVPFVFSPINLTADDDFDAFDARSIVFFDGTASATLNVTIRGDDVDEEPGVLQFIFENNDEVRVQPNENVGQIIVNDFEPLPVVAFEIAQQSASEAAGTARIRVTATPASEREIVVRTNVGGSAGRDTDYRLPDGFDRFVIAPRSTNTAIDVELINDDEPEGNENLRLSLDPPDYGELGAPATHTLTIFGAIALNDTGVLSRIGTAGSHPGQDADTGRDAELERTAFSFTKIDANGNPVAQSAPPGGWRCVRDNVTGLTWEAKSVNVDAASGTETPFVEATTDPDFDIDADGQLDVNTQAGIGVDDWRAYNARYTWYSESDSTNGGVRGSLGNFDGMNQTVSPGPQSTACGYRPQSSSRRQQQADQIFRDCQEARANGTPENPGPASCTRPIIDDGFAAPGREHAAQCNTEAYRAEMLFLNVCGVTGWRLPTIEELRGLVSYEDGTQGIDQALFFPFAPTGHALTVWSADTIPARNEQGQAYCMNANDGVVQSCTKNITNNILLVSE